MLLITKWDGIKELPAEAAIRTAPLKIHGQLIPDFITNCGLSLCIATLG